MRPPPVAFELQQARDPRNGVVAGASQAHRASPPTSTPSVSSRTPAAGMRSLRTCSNGS
ncbi:UNVERIFIED_ORG: hypothetical protein QOE_3049, partial [Clostridioides difficile F501]